MSSDLVIRQAIRSVVGTHDISREMAGMVMQDIIEGKATGAQIGAFLTAMQVKGPSVQEIAAFARVMRARAVPVCRGRGTLLDTCGTGGDGMASFNISTDCCVCCGRCRSTGGKTWQPECFQPVRFSRCPRNTRSKSFRPTIPEQ